MVAQDQIKGATLQDQVVLIAGGAGDIGAAMAQQAVAQGARVWILDQQPPHIDTQMAAAVNWVQADLSKQQQAQHAVKQAVAAAGRCDAFIAACGSLYLAPIEEIEEQALRACMDANLYANFFTIQAALVTMRQQQYGRVLVLSSDQASHGRAQGCAYGMTKAAMLQLVRALTADVSGAGNIRINCLQLGTVADTGMTLQAARELAAVSGRSEAELLSEFAGEQPTAEMVSLAQVARWGCYLCTADAAALAGSVVTLDGGLGAVR